MQKIKEIFTRNIDCISLKVFCVALLTSRQHRDKARQTQNKIQQSADDFLHNSKHYTPHITTTTMATFTRTKNKT